LTGGAERHSPGSEVEVHGRRAHTDKGRSDGGPLPLLTVAARAAVQIQGRGLARRVGRSRDRSRVATARGEARSWLAA
jgi:hypothetical protein